MKWSGLVFGAVLVMAAASGAGMQALRAPEPWGADLRLTWDGGDSRLSFNFARSIAADGAGRIHAVWYDTRDGSPQVYYKRSDDGGATWGPDTRLSMHPAAREHPAIAAAGPNVFVVWHDTRNAKLQVYFKRSTDAGQTWEPEVPLTFSGASAHASVAAFGNRLHVVYGDTRHGNAEIYTRRSTDGGATWEAEMRLSDVPYESWVPAVAVNGDNVYVAWVDYQDGNEEEYFRRSSDGGQTWEPAVRLTQDADDSWAPLLAVSGDRVHLVWFDRRDAGLTHTDVEGRLDQALLLLGQRAEPAPAPDPSRYYLPLFQQRVQEKLRRIQAAAPEWVGRGGDPQRLEAMLRDFERSMTAWTLGWEIYYKRSEDGGATWGPDTRLTQAPDASMRPSVAVDGEELHLVWFDRRDGNFEVYYKHSADGGATWSADTRLTRAPGDSLHPSLALSEGAVHVLWFDERDGNPEIYYKRRPR